MRLRQHVRCAAATSAAILLLAMACSHIHPETRAPVNTRVTVVTYETLEPFIAQFYSVTNGMTLPQVVNLLGHPLGHSRFEIENTNEQVRAFGHCPNAKPDEDGVAFVFFNRRGEVIESLYDFGCILDEYVARWELLNEKGMKRRSEQLAPLVPGSRGTPPADAGAAPRVPAGEP